MIKNKTLHQSLQDTHPDLIEEWHPTKNVDMLPADVHAGMHKKAWWLCPEAPDHEWEASIRDRAQKGSPCLFCSGRKVSRTTSLAAIWPDLAAQWHPPKNGSQTAADVTAGGHTKRWWQCAADPTHEWAASMIERKRRNIHCPFCNGHKTSVSGSLGALFPDIRKEWHPTKNVGLDPETISPKLGKKVWWVCPVDSSHEWEEYIHRRTKLGATCRICKSLTVLHPEIARQLHPTKNGILKAEDIWPSSNKKVWWACPVNPNHEWETLVSSRIKSGPRCPFCDKTRLTDETSLSAIYPDIASEWHKTKNGHLAAADVLPASNKKVWWRCGKDGGHEWEAAPNSRTGNMKSGCPFCAGRRVSATNSLAAMSPEIASQWHPVKNGLLTPNDITAGSTKAVWWKCPLGPDHEWETSPNGRGSNGCPFCANFRVSLTNSLATVRPDIAKQLHPTKNNGARADQIVALSQKHYWWSCPNGPDHEWRAQPASRTGKGGNCPFCRNQKLSVTNSLKAVNPNLAKEFHPTKNGTLTPADVVATTGKKFGGFVLKDQIMNGKLHRR